jgi:hypothetical protein
VPSVQISEENQARIIGIVQKAQNGSLGPYMYRQKYIYRRVRNGGEGNKRDA